MEFTPYKGQQVRRCDCGGMYDNTPGHAPDCAHILDTDAIENDQE